MGINKNTLPIRGRHEAAPVAEGLKSIVDHDSKITLLGSSKWVSEKGCCELPMIQSEVDVFA